MIETGLAGKVVVVTGGAAGIGRAVARRFAREGARVSVWDRREGADSARELLVEGAADAEVRVVDVARVADVAAATEAVLARWGHYDVLINNAGIARDAQLVKARDGVVLGGTSDEDFDAVVDVNLRGVFVCARAAVAAMIRGGRGGVVLNAASVVAHHGNFGQTSYAAAKAGVVAMTRTWARELGRHGIRVNAVAPGFIATAMVDALPPGAREHVVAHTPLGRTGTVEEVAEAYLWLASEAASFVHGAVLSIDGGLVLGT